MQGTQRINHALRQVPAWVIYLAGLLIPAWLVWQAMNGALGVEPVKELEHRLGLLGLQFLIATLAITPLRRATSISLIHFRRALGLMTFWLICCHFAVWLVLDIQFAGVWADIVKRPYITVGMVGLVAMVPLAITSNNLSMRKMGPVRWRRLHKLTYLAAVAGGIHYVMQAKTWLIEPLVYLAVIALLLATRLKRSKRRAAA